MKSRLILGFPLLIVLVLGTGVTSADPIKPGLPVNNADKITLSIDESAVAPIAKWNNMPITLDLFAAPAGEGIQPPIWALPAGDMVDNGWVNITGCNPRARECEAQSDRLVFFDEVINGVVRSTVRLYSDRDTDRQGNPSDVGIGRFNALQPSPTLHAGSVGEMAPNGIAQYNTAAPVNRTRILRSPAVAAQMARRVYRNRPPGSSSPPALPVCSAAAGDKKEGGVSLTLRASHTVLGVAADVPRRPSSSSMGVPSHSAIKSIELRSGQQRRGAGSNSSIRCARMRRRNTDSLQAPTHQESQFRFVSQTKSQL